MIELPKEEMNIWLHILDSLPKLILKSDPFKENDQSGGVIDWSISHRELVIIKKVIDQINTEHTYVIRDKVQESKEIATPEYIQVLSSVILTREEYDKLIRVSDQEQMEVGELIEGMVMAGIKHSKLKK